MFALYVVNTVTEPLFVSLSAIIINPRSIHTIIVVEVVTLAERCVTFSL